MDVLLTDEQYLRFAQKFADLLIEFGFIREDEREAEIEYVLKQWREKPYAHVN